MERPGEMGHGRVGGCSGALVELERGKISAAHGIFGDVKAVGCSL